MAGYRFESPAIVDDMLAALASTPGALPLLQFAAAKLWDARDRAEHVISQASYAAIGGVVGALASHADEFVAALSTADQRVVRSILLRLVTPERTRAIVALSDLSDLERDPADLKRLVDHLVAARLLMVHAGQGAEGTAVEIVHESLITSWPTLGRWLDAGQEDAAFLAQLQAAAKQWDQKGRPVGLLWRKEAYEEAQRFRRRYRGELGQREEVYLEAVFALATRSARFKRRMVIAAFMLLGTLLAASAVVTMKVRSANQAATTQADLARREAERAREAEKRVTEQMTVITERERLRAEAEQKASQATEQVAESKEELRATNARLQGALADAEQAAQKAMKTARDNAQLAEAIERKNTELERLLVKERERAIRAEKQESKISKSLK